MMQIDLNADLGEGFGPWRMGEDEALLGLVSSANVACGFHAGDPAIMDRTVRTRWPAAWTSARMSASRTARASAAGSCRWIRRSWRAWSSTSSAPWPASPAAPATG